MSAVFPHPQHALDTALFEQLFREHSTAIFRFCLRRTGDPVAADDHRSKVFLEAWRRREEVDLATREALPWLYAVAVNVMRNQARSNRRRQAAVLRLPLLDAEQDKTEDIAERIDASERARAALEQVKELSRGEREVVLLCLASEMSYRAAAGALGLPIGTVRSRLSRARTRLIEGSLAEQRSRLADPSHPAGESADGRLGAIRCGCRLRTAAGTSRSR
jgi:RNA polymerase sigma factor (sigma-70 family)